MNFQKLTYSGTKCNNYIYFSFDGEYFDTAIITNRLNIEPTSVKNKKEPVSKLTSWKFQIDVGDEIDLGTPLKNIIQIFESKIEEINELKEKFNLETRVQFVIDIDINPESSTPYFPITQNVISFLYKTGTDVDFDIYKSDTMGILEGN